MTSSPHKEDPREGHPGANTSRGTAKSPTPSRVDDPAPFSVCIAELVEILAKDRPDFEAGWKQGFAAGYRSGWDVGHAAAEHERDEQWRAIATPITELCSRLPAYAEMEKYRNSGHGPAYEQAVARRGGRPYLGGPVRWAS